MSETRKPWAIYAITKHGIQIAENLVGHLPQADLYVSEKLFSQISVKAQKMGLPMGPTLEKNFKAYDAHIFIISVGAVVRMVAPLFENKKVDPAILCVDDNAQFVIPILSGHVGRGNEFTHRVAKILNATPVITTASDVRGTLTVDILGRDLGWILDDLDRNVTLGCAAVVNQQPVLIIQETGEPNFWPLDQSLPPGVDYTNSFENGEASAHSIFLVITDRDFQNEYPEIYSKTVIYRPKSLVLGLGCDSQTPFELVERGIKTTLEKYKLDIRCVKAIASVEKKANEPAFLELKKKYNWEFKIFSSEELDGVQNIPNPSEIVKNFIGTKGVAEPSALLAAGAPELLIPKQIYKEPEIPRSMTIAVARIPFAARQNSPQPPLFNKEGGVEENVVPLFYLKRGKGGV